MFGANSRASLSVVLECHPANVFNPTALVRQDTRAMTRPSVSCADHITRPAAPAHPNDVEVRRVQFGSVQIDQEVAAGLGRAARSLADLIFDGSRPSTPNHVKCALPSRFFLWHARLMHFGRLTGSAPSSRDANNATEIRSAWLAVAQTMGRFNVSFIRRWRVDVYEASGMPAETVIGNARWTRRRCWDLLCYRSEQSAMGQRTGLWCRNDGRPGRRSGSGQLTQGSDLSIVSFV